MTHRHLLRLLFGALIWAALTASPGLTGPDGGRIGLGGAAAAQGHFTIDDFYDALDPYGEWVWHPRYGYVWLPVTVSPRWRPYTVGRWIYTDEYGWYWNSHEPFAWAVYHYGRWGYNPDYGWFWVPGDVWAPAWVQWRYSDNYVGWAPIGPQRPGYAYGVPVGYEPPIAESWVFVQPRYLTSRAVSHHALSIGALNVAFMSATQVYRPQYRGGVIYNYGMPREKVVKIIKRPIVVEKVYKVDKRDWKDRGRGNDKTIRVYAPGVAKDAKPKRGPRKFVDDPKNFKPKAKLHETVKGEPPKGWGRSAKSVTPITKEDPDAFKRPRRFDGPDRDFGERGRDKDKDRDGDKSQAAKEPSFKPGAGPDGGKQATQSRDEQKDKNKENEKDKGQSAKADDRGDRGKDASRDRDKAKTLGSPGGKPPSPGWQGKPQTKEAAREDADKDKNRNRQKNEDRSGGNKGKSHGATGGPGGPAWQGGGGGGRDARGGDGGGRDARGRDGGGRDARGGGGGGRDGGGQGRKQAEGGGGGGKKDKCQKNPDHPSCKN